MTTSDALLMGLLLDTPPINPSGGGGGGSRYTVESLTFSGGLITDAVREAGVEGDGLTPPAGVGIWPAATNLVLNGGFETDATGTFAQGGGTTTVTRVTDEAKFGSASMRAVTDGNAGDQGLGVGTATGGATNAIVVSPSTAYTFSGWAKGTGTIKLNVNWYTAAGAYISTSVGTAGAITLSSTWARLSRTYTSPATAARAAVFFLTSVTNQAITFYVDGVQSELGSIATPYIETDGSTESRTAGRVFDDANEIAIDSSQFAVAVRWNPGIANTALSTGTAVLFEKVVDANNLVRGLYDWQNDRYELQRVESGSGSSHTKAHTFTAQSSQTVIFQGTPTGLTISVGGNFDAETANTATPDVSTADLDYGSSAGSSSFLDGNARFISTFTGELTNDDAARIAAIPSPPTWAQLVGALPSSAGVGTLWPGVDATFFKAA